MKVAVVNSQTPFVRGGAELLADWLVTKVEEYGHRAELVRLPFTWWPPQRVLEHTLAVRLIELPNVDRVVALRFPAYFVRHPEKVLWLLHQFRQAYELRGTAFDELARHEDGESVAALVARADSAYLLEARRIYTNSAIVSGRLRRYNGVESEVLYPPLLDSSGYRCDDFARYVFAPGRLSEGKRQCLLIEAMAHVRSDVRLVIAGSPDHDHELTRLQRLVEEHGVGSRVELRGTWISEDDKRALFANALACAYVAFDEDSYGYVTLESYESRKPVITCTDSGGTLELVADGETGRVVEPEPRALAEAIDDLAADPARARTLGEAGYERMRSLDISWDHVVDRLLA